MSHVVLHGPGFLVVDDLLQPATFASLSNEIHRGEYRSVHAKGWDKAWRLWDGSPLRGESVYFDPTGAFRREGPRYPTHSAVDPFFEAVHELTARYPEIAGTEGVDWVAAFLSPWLYPVGSSLSLHCDGGGYSGAFTFFAHREWRVHWGGELFVLQDDGSAGAREPRVSAGDEESWIPDGDGVEDETPLGIATCVFPRPNRLVLIAPDRPHMIRRVDPNAGSHVRTSLAGFFLRPR